MTEPLRLHWSGNPDGTEKVSPDGGLIGWVIDTKIGLTQQMIQTAAEYAAKIQKDRLRGMASGEQRDALARALALLERGRVRQNLAGEGDRVILDAYQSAGPKIFYSGMN